MRGRADKQDNGCRQKGRTDDCSAIGTQANCRLRRRQEHVRNQLTRLFVDLLCQLARRCHDHSNGALPFLRGRVRVQGQHMSTEVCRAGTSAAAAACMLAWSSGWSMMCTIMGSTKAAVLPLPVLAMPCSSRQRSTAWWVGMNTGEAAERPTHARTYLRNMQARRHSTHSTITRRVRC